MHQPSDPPVGQAATAAVAITRLCLAAATDENGFPVRWTGRQAIVTLPQQMDESNAGQVREKLLLVIGRGATELTHTDSCDHMGADAAASAYQRVVAEGSQLRLVVTAPAVRHVLTLNGLDRLIPVYPSLAATMAGASAAQVPGTPGDWPLAAAMVIDDLAIGQLLPPRDGTSLASQFAGLPSGQAWAEPQPYLISAAMALSAGHDQACAAALDAADGLLGCPPAGQGPECRLAAALTRLTACLRTGDLDAAEAAAGRAQMLLSEVPPGKLARHPEVAARVLSGRGTIELWSGRLDEAARVLHAGAEVMASPGGQDERADCTGRLALVEALRGRLRHAAELAAQAGAGSAAQKGPAAGQARPAGLVALAWVHLERHELREARSCLQRAETALSLDPDTMIQTVAYLVAAGGALAEGRATVAAQVLDRARAGRPVSAWLDQQLNMVRSRACAATGDIPAALAAAEEAGSDDRPEAAVTRAHAWATAGDSMNARRALAPALAAGSHAADRVRLHTWLVDARISYASGDHTRGRRSLGAALRLAEPEQLRLPFAMERGWIGPALRRHPDLADPHRRLLAPALDREPLPARPDVPDQAPPLVVEPLSEREREVLRHASGMLSTAEIASQMYISANTVKTHLRSIYRKLAASHRGEAVRRARQLGLI